MPTETLSTSTEDVSALNEKNKKILDALDITDPKGEELKKVIGELSRPEILASIQDATKATIHNSALVIMYSGGPNNDRERLILQLQARLFPSVALNMKLEQTAKPSESLKGIIKQDGTIDTEALKNLSPDQIREKIGKLNKADLKLAIKGLDGLENGLLKATIMQVVTPFVDTMVQNGYSIEDMSDIDFLEKNAGEKTKKIISEWKTKGEGKDFDGKKKYIIKGEKILPLTNDTGELTRAGIDISKINTVDPKAGAEQLRRQLPASFNKVQFGEFINSLAKSDNRLLKGLGEILKIFGALLGIDFGEKKEAGGEKLSGKQKRELLIKMKGKNDDYDISTFFDVTGSLVDKKDDPGFQKYLGDIDKILGPGFIKKTADGKLYIFDKNISEGALAYQDAYKVQPRTGKFDIPTITKLLEKMDVEGKPIETPQAQPAAALPGAPERAPEVVKHKYSDLYKGLENFKTYESIKADSTARKLIQDAVSVTEANYGPKTKAAVKLFQERELGVPIGDGFFGPKTIALLKAKIDKETPPPAKK